MGEDVEDVRRWILAALRAGLIPFCCIHRILSEGRETAQAAAELRGAAVIPAPFQGCEQIPVGAVHGLYGAVGQSWYLQGRGCGSCHLRLTDIPTL